MATLELHPGRRSTLETHILTLEPGTCKSSESNMASSNRLYTKVFVFNTCLRPQQAIETLTDFYQKTCQDLRNEDALYFCVPKAPAVSFLPIFFDTCFRPQQAIEKSTEFYKQDLPRFRQLKYSIFVGPRLQMFFLGLLSLIPVFG